MWIIWQVFKSEKWQRWGGDGWRRQKVEEMEYYQELPLSAKSEYYAV